MPDDLGPSKETSPLRGEDEGYQPEQYHQRLYQLMRDMCDNVPDMIWAKDLEKRYIFANKALCQRLLCTDPGEDPVGKNDLTFARRQREAHPEDPGWHTFGEVCQDSDSAVLGSGRAERFDEFGNVRGEFLFLDVHKAPFLDAQGRMIGTVGCGRDVTHEKSMEERLRQSELRYRTMFATAAVPILEEDFSAVKQAVEELRAAGVDDFRDYFERHPEFVQRCAGLARVVDVNGATLELYEADSKAQLLGSVERVLGPDSYSAFRQVVLAIAERRTRLDLEASNRTLKGKTIQVIVRLVVPAEDSEFRNVLVSIIDVTARKQLEAEQQKAQKLESLGVLAGGIAHDFNNLLMGIMGNLSMAKLETEPGSKARRRLEDAEAASDRARGLTQQLLTFAKGSQPVKRAVPVRPHLEDTARFSLSGSNVACRFAFDEDIQPMSADADQLAQVVSNLILNAAEAMPQGGIIDLAAHNRRLAEGDSRALEAGDYVEISVRDQGVGIPAEFLPRIFDPYFTTKKGGSGLGLAIADSILQKHGGRISVVSEPGRGSTFSILVPAAGGDASGLSQADATGQYRGQGRVLIMDDDDVVAGIAADIIEYFGYASARSADGRAMLEMYQQAQADGKPFDLVLMDLTIPGGMGGVDAIRHLLRLDPEAKAIVSSGYANDPVFADPRAYGFRGLLVKPYTAEDLGRVLREVLQGGRIAATGTSAPTLLA